MKIDFSFPKIMGILNITPDSFYDGNRYTHKTAILKQVEKMLEEGANIIDIGAFSSRPGANFVTYKTERERLIPHLNAIVKNFPNTIISIDTYRHQIAREAIEKGAHIINDISGGNLDKKMFETIASLQVPYIMMHMKGIPKNMQKKTEYQNVVKEIINFFKLKIKILSQMNFNEIIIDPGFGFGKTLEQNYQILNKLEEFNKFNLPILVGVSRKSMLYKLLNGHPKDMLNATTVVNTIALTKGAKILRVHDVKQAVEIVKIINKIKESTL